MQLLNNAEKSEYAINKKENAIMELRSRFLKVSDNIREANSVLKSWFNKNKEPSVLPNGITQDYLEEGQVFGFDYKCIGTFDGYKVIHATELMREANTYFGSIFYTFPLNNSTEALISVDSWFDNMSDNAQEFVLSHEVGHLKDKRGREAVERDSMIRVSGFVKGVVEAEQIADDYAVAKIGKENAIDAMKEIIETVKGTFLCTEELELRLNRIKEEKQ